MTIDAATAGGVSPLPAEAEKRARDLFGEGFVCSEAVAAAFEETCGMTLSDDLKRSLTGLAEGLGSGDLCGAIAGAVIVTGSLAGRLGAREPRDLARRITREIVERLRQPFGATSCRAIRKKAALVPGLSSGRHCPVMTGLAARTAVEIVLREGLAKAPPRGAR